SVHYLKKTVAGAPLVRPGWWFDPREAGEAVADVGTHLADLAMWLLFPDRAIAHWHDLAVLDAACWPTPLDRGQFAAVTGLPDFAEVVREFADYFHNPRLIPAWERPNLLAKYYLTTAAVGVARAKQART